MATWQEENLSAILEYPFDFDRYIAKQLREIDDLDERIFAKKVLMEGLGRVIRQTEQKYQALEKRVYQEISIPDNAYGIVSTVVKRADYDPTNDTLFPVVPMDLDSEKAREALSTEEALYVGTVFLKADRVTCRGFENKGRLQAFLLVEGEEKEICTHIKKADRYREVMAELYRMFQDNHILWETVNTGYMDKLYDIYVYKEDIPAETVSLENLRIDYGKYREAVQIDMLLLWNIERITFDSMNFMVPCIDGIYYEHEFTIEDENREDGYLIKINEDISEIRHERGKIIIKSGKETFENWTAIRIVQKNTVRSLDYNAPLLSNRKQDTFIRRYSSEAKVSLLTRAELFRRIMELDITDYIEVTDYEIIENGEEYPAQESMNWFVRDELFPMEGRKVLLLTFQEKEPGNYLNDSMVWFVISKLQTEINEYRCVGRTKRISKLP